MKIYTVMPGLEKVTECDDASVFLGSYFEPEVFMEEGDAVDAAQRLARKYPSISVWITEGQAVRSYRCEPFPVLESLPSVTVVAQ